MAYLQLHDRQIPLRAGETTIGASAGVDIAIAGVPSIAPVAVVVAGAAGVVIRQGAVDGGVKVNGVALGPEPVPLIHGDRVDVAGATLIFGDAAKGGSTAFFSGANVAELLKQRASTAGGAAPRQPTAGTGGRLVSLVDGREYVIVNKPFTIGRDPACDVVIASGEVSRTHAEIESGTEGYYLIDTSTNGVAVNGARVDGTITLARGDVLRIGPEEFRFYADKAPAAAPPAAPVPAAAPIPPAAPVAPAAAMAAAAVAAVAAVPAPAPAGPPPAPPRVALAHLEVHGSGEPQTFDLTEVLAQVGRGGHNDVVIREDSVSDSHAKLQRRGDGWWVVDMQSTNGTFVDGVRVDGERSLGPRAELKFGAIRATFRVAGVSPMASGKGETAVLSSALAAQLAQQAKAPPAPVPPAPTPVAAPAVPSPPPVAPRAATPAPRVPYVPPAPPPTGGGVPAWVWLVVALVVAGGAYFFLKGR
ncbi:MAG: FHA domain-containing protein [Gemmatimonadaceae bacterium]|jgi:pSer/pThr/pTyr-binding forkhead associated (FHA) protein|nr:FHA domain-containing protein [Gemmatimonadaceae bacterium]